MTEPFADPAVPDGYEQHFGLVESPFTLTSNPRFLFESSSHLAALRELAYALPRREPIIVVTGAIGTGKTTLCRIIAERRGPRTFVATINTPPSSVDDLLRLILDGFNVLADDTSRIVQASHYGLLRTLQQFLASLVPLNAQAIILFDEAQHLSPAMLEQIRLLSNIDVDSRKLLQIILVGQPELDELLARDDLRQLSQRISRRHRLGPLEPTEVNAYVARRISVAQGDQALGHAPVFTAAAIRAIWKLSNGVPRIVNTICDRALELAWSERTHVVDGSTIVTAARSLEIEVPRAMRVSASRRTVLVAAATVIAVAGVASVWWVRRGPAPTDAAATAPVGDQVARSATPAAPPSAPSAAPRVTPPAAAATPAAAPAARSSAGTAPSAATTAPAPNAAGRFLILVSSFRTVEPAIATSKNIAALGLPASTRSLQGWQQVVVGPYASRAEAVRAQERLITARMDETRIVELESAPSNLSPPAARAPSPAAPAATAEPPGTRPAASPAAAAPNTREQSAPASPPPPALAPLPDDAPIAAMLERANVLAAQPNVRALQQIRNQVAKRHAAATGSDAAPLKSALDQVDKYLEDARRRQLENDARRLGGDPGAR